MDFKQKLVFITIGLIFWPTLAFAHQPVFEPETNESFAGQSIYLQAREVADPTVSSLALYGSTAKASEVDVFVFIPSQSAEIPIDFLVPIIPANKNYKPELFIAAKDLPKDLVIDSAESPVVLPEGYSLMKIKNNHTEGKLFEPFSMERYWQSNQVKLNVVAKQNYFLIVKEPNQQFGSYAIGVGTVENFADTNYFTLLSTVVSLKLGLLNGQPVPWQEIIGIFLLLAGLIIGLGAVTVIDFHGFLARKSEYWTETTIRAHKITKPLIWLGLLLLLIGFGIIYKDGWLTGVGLFQAFIVLILLINGLFLTFYISPRLLQREKDGDISKILPDSLQQKIFISFMISFVSWWTLVFLTAWYFVILR